MPFNSVYRATKWALEGWSESLAFELKEFGIKVKTVSPGGIATDFAGSSLVLTQHHAYDEQVAKVMTVFMHPEREQRITLPRNKLQKLYLPQLQTENRHHAMLQL